MQFIVSHARDKRTSVAEPNPDAKGNVTKLGTKNTGNHFAKIAAPGDNALNIDSPCGNANNVANNAPHPANDDGKDIFACCNI